MGDRHSWGVKAAILDTLTILLHKGGVSLKAFAPQLQTTFVKSLNDPTRAVRVGASSALQRLISLGLTTRVDPLLAELAVVVSTGDSIAIKASVIDALANVLQHSVGKASTSVLLEKIEPVLLASLDVDDATVRSSSIACLGKLVPFFAVEHLKELVEVLLHSKMTSTASQVGRVLGASSVLRSMTVTEAGVRGEVFCSIDACLSHEESSVRLAGCR